MAIERLLIKSKDGMLLKGISIVAFGLVALCYPGEEIYTMMPAFGILVTINGLAMMLNNIWFFKSDSKWGKSLLRNGIVETLIGTTALWFTVASIPAFWELIALWAIFNGSVQADRFRGLKSRSSERHIMIASGIATIIFGAFILVNLKMEIISFTYEVAIFALIAGSCMIYAFFRLGKMQDYLRDKPRKIHSRKTTVYYDRPY
jgi:uncharacterized membrane protein HdeD (DUF308 family)